MRSVWTRRCAARPCARISSNKPGRYFLSAEARELLLEAREPAAAVEQLLLAAGPGRVRLGIDVEAQRVAFLAPGGAGGEFGAVGHHHLDGVVVRMQVGFHGGSSCASCTRVQVDRKSRLYNAAGPTKQGISLTLAVPGGTRATGCSDRSAQLRTCCHTHIPCCSIAARRKPRSPVLRARRVWGNPLRHGRAEGADFEKQPIATCARGALSRRLWSGFGQSS